MKMDGVPNAQIRVCGEAKGVAERINENVLQCFSHIGRMEKYKIAKRIYMWKNVDDLVG